MEPAKRKKRKPTPKELVAEDKAVEEITDLEVAKKLMKIYQSAVDRSLEFNLTFNTVKRLLLYKTCFYTNRVFEEDGPYSRSFDRVDSSKGYIEGNVVACTIDINGKKSNLSVDEIVALYNKLVKQPQTLQTYEHDERRDSGRDDDQGTQPGDPS